MEFTLSELVNAFVYSLVLGFIIGVCYEPVRIFHRLGFESAVCYFITDVVFMVFCSLCTFFFSLAYLEGSVRFFVIAGEIIGFSAFHFALCPILNKIYDPLIKISKKIIEKLLKSIGIVMYNVVYIFKKIYSRFIGKIFKVIDYGQKRNDKRTASERRRGKYKRGHSQKEKTQ